MGKIQKEIVELDEQGNVVYDVTQYHRDSTIFKFLNFNLETPEESLSNEVLLSIFDYDPLISAEVVIAEKNLSKLEDFSLDRGLLQIYFSLLQNAFRSLLLKTTNLILNPEARKPGYFPLGPLGELSSYEDLLLPYRPRFFLGTLSNQIEGQIKSFEQCLVISLVEFIKDKTLLKYLRLCQRKECQKVYFVTRGNFKFCTPVCGKIQNDLNRDQSNRYSIEILNPKSGRSKALANRTSVKKLPKKKLH